MKIYVLTTSYPDKLRPSLDIFVFEQVKALMRCGHDVLVLNVAKLPTKMLFSKADHSVQLLDDEFGKRLRVNMKTCMESRFPWLNRDSFVRAMRRLFREACARFGAPDLLYAHFSCWAGLAGAYLSKEYNIPLVTLEHNGRLLRPEIPRSMKTGVRKTICGSDAFLCVSQGLKDSILKNIYAEKEITVVPNMVDPGFRFQPRQMKDCFRFLSIANLYEGKGMKVLIEAFALAFPADAPVELVIGGNGPEYENLKKQIDALGRSGQIRLLGRLDRAQTIREYTRCDSFVLASRFETYGLVYREALATGRPIITTDHGGFSGADWHDAYGYKVPVDDVPALAERLKQMTVEYETFDLEAISGLCLEDCAPQKITKRLTDIFEAVLDERGRRGA